MSVRRWKRMMMLSASALFMGFTSIAQSSDIGFTESGHPFKGNVDAVVTLVEYSDYLCPYCARHNNQTVPELIEKYVDSGKVKLEFRHFPIAQLHPTAARGHEAAACAAQQSADAFWQYHNALFTRQKEWNRLADPSEFLAEVATSLELDINEWKQCVDDRSHGATVNRDVDEGKALGFNGTPTFQLISSAKPDTPYTISGARSTEFFSNAIDALLAGEEPPPPPERPKPELPNWAKPDALAPDPKRPGFTVSGDPYHGDDSAPLVIVEFTDYQCPACAKHALETQPAIEEQLIDTGKVRWVSRHLPLPVHKNAMVAAAAAECAARQGKFHEMQTELFTSQDQWADLEAADTAFVAMAEKIEIDNSAFVDCLGSREALEGVLTDVYEATSVSRATPVFVVLDGVTGRPIRGRRTPEKFVEIISKYLESVSVSDIRESDDKS